MTLLKRYGVAFLVGFVGVLVALGAVRLYTDYQDFVKMRLWVAGIQQQQAAMQAQQKPAEK